MNQKLNAFIDTLSELQACGGNCVFEHRLFEKISAAGKQIGDLTVAEFLDLHDAAALEYTEIESRIQARFDRAMQ